MPYLVISLVTPMHGREKCEKIVCNNFLHSEDRELSYILIIKPKICTNITNLFLE